MFPSNASKLDLERLTARVFDTARAGCRLETYRDGDTYNIDIDLPGVDPADIDVNVERNVLTVRAARRPASAHLRLADKPDPVEQPGSAAEQRPGPVDQPGPAAEQPEVGELAEVGQKPGVGECTRQVVLSDRLDTDELEARYDSGVLTLRIPIVEPADLGDLAKAA